METNFLKDTADIIRHKWLFKARDGEECESSEQDTRGNKFVKDSSILDQNNMYHITPKHFFDTSSVVEFASGVENTNPS